MFKFVISFLFSSIKIRMIINYIPTGSEPTSAVNTSTAKTAYNLKFMFHTLILVTDYPFSIKKNEISLKCVVYNVWSKDILLLKNLSNHKQCQTKLSVLSLSRFSFTLHNLWKYSVAQIKFIDNKILNWKRKCSIISYQLYYVSSILNKKYIQSQT